MIVPNHHAIFSLLSAAVLGLYGKCNTIDSFPLAPSSPPHQKKKPKFLFFPSYGLWGRMRCIILRPGTKLCLKLKVVGTKIVILESCVDKECDATVFLRVSCINQVGLYVYVTHCREVGGVLLRSWNYFEAY